MKKQFSVKISALKLALQKVTRAVANHSHYGAMVTLVGEEGGLSVHKTDGSSFARASVEGEKIPSFKMVVDGLRLQQILATAVQADEVKIDLEDEKIRLNFGKAKIKLDKLEAEPMLLESHQWNGASESFKVDGGELQKALKQVATACARNHTSFFLNGVFFTTQQGKVVLASTNGFVLTRFQTEIQADTLTDTIVPITVVDSLIGNLEENDAVTILSFDQKDKPRGIGFRTESFEVLCPAIVGNYPNIEKTIPAIANGNYQVVTVSAVEMVNALDRIGLMSSFSRGIGVQLELGPDAVTVSEIGGESNEAVNSKNGYEGVPMTIGFNPHQLAGVIKAANCEAVRIFVSQTGDVTSMPICLTADNDLPTWKTVVMPVRI